ncbi:hypothetical protein SAMN05421813_10757 [Daejeonella rubra]|uniref:Uncharacterized protein n=1 Tax=Daejeonella rubra TaxID=990371 RepID=A0A1G9R1Y7_9SPHI|nr:hypothetical protein SAMN05421813_10757 [Daejeonella rubra]
MIYRHMRDKQNHAIDLIYRNIITINNVYGIICNSKSSRILFAIFLFALSYISRFFSLRVNLYH